MALAALVTLVGCGSSSSGGGSIEIANFAAESAKASCARIYKCCDATERAGDPTWGPTEADCVTALTTQAMAAVALRQSGLDGGKIVYHGDRAKSCLANVAALSCDWGVTFQTRYVPDCAHVFDGTVANAGTCTMDEECMSGFCSLVNGCTARGKVGEACTAPTACEDGLFCPVSAGDACVAAGAIGAACEVGVSCQNNSCVIPDGMTSGTCGAPMMCNGQ